MSDQLQAIRETLEACKQWHQGDKWRDQYANDEHDAWQAQLDKINAAIVALSSSQQVREEALPNPHCDGCALEIKAEPEKPVSRCAKHANAMALLIGDPLFGLDVRQPASPSQPISSLTPVYKAAQEEKNQQGAAMLHSLASQPSMSMYASKADYEAEMADCLIHGMGWMSDGKHIPIKDVLQPSSVAMTDGTARDALQRLYDVVIARNRLGTDWGDLFAQMMGAVSYASNILQSSPKGASTGTEMDDYCRWLVASDTRDTVQRWEAWQARAALSSDKEASKPQDEREAYVKALEQALHSFVFAMDDTRASFDSIWSRKRLQKAEEKARTTLSSASADANVGGQTLALQEAHAAVQEFRRAWIAVPYFADRVNRATREAISAAISHITNMDAVGGPLDLRRYTPTAPEPSAPADKVDAPPREVIDAVHWALAYLFQRSEIGKAELLREAAKYLERMK